jgi:hypothetical protein
MTDMTTLQTQLDSLRAAYASGARSIGYDGKTITYRDADEMRAAIAALENQINGPSTPRTILVRSKKGW